MGGIGTNFISHTPPSVPQSDVAWAKALQYNNPWGIKFNWNRGRMPSISWTHGNGTTPIMPLPSINVSRGPMPFWQTFSFWSPTRNWRPIQFAPKLGAKASYTGWGFPSTWFTLHLPVAQPDLQTGLSRRYRPIVQKYQFAGGASQYIPGVFVPIRPTGPGLYTGGQGSTQQ